jgi:hypothetical protein
VAVALGWSGLAAAASNRSLSVEASDHQRRLLLIALVVWPIITGLPAFLLAWVISGIIAHLRLSGIVG